MQCAHCGSNVPDGAATCPVCGAEVTPASSDSPFKRPGDMGADGFSLSEESVSPVYKPHASVRCPVCGTPMTETDKFCTKCGATSPLCSDDAAQRLSGSGIRVNLGSGHAPAAGDAPTADSSASDVPPAAASSAPHASSVPPASSVSHVSSAPHASSAQPAPSAPSASFANIFMRRLCGSPLHLVTTIFCTLMALVNTILICNATLPPLKFAEGEEQITLIISLLYSIIPMLCWVIGLWVLFGAAKSASGRTFSTGGLTTIKVTFIVILVMDILAIVYAIYKLIDTGVFEYFDLLPSDQQTFLVSFLAGMAIGLTLRIILEAKIITTTSATARTVHYNTIAPIPSAYVGTMMFISSALVFLLPFLLVALVGQLSGAFDYGVSYSDLLGQMFADTDMVSLLWWLLSIVSFALLGALSVHARKVWRACLAR